MICIRMTVGVDAFSAQASIMRGTAKCTLVVTASLNTRSIGNRAGFYLVEVSYHHTAFTLYVLYSIFYYFMV